MGEEVTAIGGHYVPEREERIEVDGREVIYLVGYGVVDTSCCGQGGARYALVPGYIRKWKYTSNEDGQEVSEVELVTSEAEMKEIKTSINERELLNQVNFW